MMSTDCIYLLLYLIFLSCADIQDQRPETDRQVIRLQEGTNFSATTSPDGNQIVFDALGRLWLREYDNPLSTPLTDPHGNARQPRWQPQGRLIAFQGYWEGHWHIYTIDESGKSLQQITSGAFDHREPDWSADGQSLLFSSDRSGNYDIWQYDLKRMNFKQLTSDITNEYAPSSDPVGKNMVYLSDDPNAPGIYVQDQGTGHSSILLASENQLFAPSYSKDGRQVFFNQLDSTGSRLYSYDLGSTNPPQVVSQLNDVFPFRVSWTKGNHLFFTANGGIYKFNVTSAEAARIPLEYQVSFQAAEYRQKSRNFDPANNLPVLGLSQPRLSPNAESVVLVALGDIWLVHRNGSKKQITDDPFVELSPVWSPDGSKLAYISDRSGQLSLWTTNIETGKEALISTIVGSVSGIDWSPAEDKVAVVTTFGPRLGRISIYDLASKSLSATSPMITSSLGAPSWNSSGTRIAVSALTPFSTLYREGVNQVLYYDADGNPSGRLSNTTNFSIGVRGSDGPLWSPDGKYLASISSGALMLFPVDEQGQLVDKPRRLFEGIADNPSWAADSRHLLFIDVDQLKVIDILTGEMLPFAVDLTWDRISPTTQKVIHAGHLFDGRSESLQRDVDIHIDGHRIVKVEPHQTKQDSGITYIDASDKYIMPGLIDGHAHQGSWEGRNLDLAWLSWGVTSTRDPATNPYDALNRREARQSGHTIGPRIFYTGPPFDGSRIYYSGASALHNQSQIALELDRADRLDYDMIKTYVRLADPLQKEIIAQAHKIGLPVSSHELYPAAISGIDGIEHISGTSRRGYSAKLSSQFIAYSDVTTLIARSGITFTPTTGIYIAFSYLLSLDDTPLQDPRVLAFVDPGNLARIRGGVDQIKLDPKGSQRRFENALKMVGDVHRQGGLITAGTDGPIIPFGFALHMELESYTHAGMSNFEVLKTATSNAAKLLHADQDLGTIETGKLADILILNENPLQDIRNARSVHGVLINGKLHLLQEILDMQP